MSDLGPCEVPGCGLRALVRRVVNVCGLPHIYGDSEPPSPYTEEKQ